ncbi:MAG: hypothetical protein ATN36_01030 [Epulopiscium sp. Nele67-Bin005]|nr:MAG: hypothetical protein ATN36_01030 [Epulopiscium sp. Nele67-Bin005]
MQNTFYHQSIIGSLRIDVFEGAVIGIKFEEGTSLDTSTFLQEVCCEIDLYLQGNLTEFSFPIKLFGTPFQLRVWNALLNIPYGQTCTYKDIATKIDCPKGARAVGLANNKNPIMIVVPCHRVIGANGKLTGYAGGIDIKKFLLDIEK